MCLQASASQFSHPRRYTRGRFTDTCSITLTQHAKHALSSAAALRQSLPADPLRAVRMLVFGASSDKFLVLVHRGFYEGQFVIKCPCG